MEIEFSPPRTVLAEGSYIAVASCLECGAAILLNLADDENPRQRHREWHQGLESQIQGFFAKPDPE